MAEVNKNLIRDLFKNFLFILNISGMKISRIHGSNALTCIRRSFALIILLSMSVYTILLTKSWMSEKSWSGVKISKISLSIWFMECTGVYVFLLYWQVKDRFIVHVRMLYAATCYAGVVWYHKKLSMVIAALFVMCIISNLFLIGTYVDFQITLNETNVSLVEKSFMEGTFGKGLQIFTYFYTLLAYTITSAMLLFFCTIDTVEFYHLTKQFKDEKVLTASLLKMYFTKHTKLVCAVDHLNNTFCFYIFLQMFGIIPIIILYIYGLFTGLCELDINSIPWMVVLPAMVLIFTLAPAAINSAASEMLDIVYQKADFYELDKMSEFYQTISWFAVQCANKPAGITIGNFFLITNSFLLSAVSIIITFVTLLLDTSKDSNGTVPRVAKNGTT